jgi:hypothetical protein
MPPPPPRKKAAAPRQMLMGGLDRADAAINLGVNQVIVAEEGKVGIGEKVAYYFHRGFTMARLSSEMLYLKQAMNSRKDSLAEVYDKYAEGDFAGAEEIYQKAKADVDEYQWAYDKKLEEFNLLRKEGESETVTKPGSEQSKRRKAERERKMEELKKRMNGARESMTSVAGKVSANPSADPAALAAAGSIAGSLDASQLSAASNLAGGAAGLDAHQMGQLSAAGKLAGSLDADQIAAAQNLASMDPSDPAALAAAGSIAGSLDANQLSAASNLAGGAAGLDASQMSQLSALALAIHIYLRAAFSMSMAKLLV